MKKALAPIPPFASEGEERAYWDRTDSTAISLRLPIALLEQTKNAANKRVVPYQSLIKIWLSEKVG